VCACVCVRAHADTVLKPSVVGLLYGKSRRSSASFAGNPLFERVCVRVRVQMTFFNLAPLTLLTKHLRHLQLMGGGGGGGGVGWLCE